MKKRAIKYLRMLSVMLLLISTIAPSVAFAEGTAPAPGTSMHTITVNSGKEGREINTSSLVIASQETDGVTRRYNGFRNTEDQHVITVDLSGIQPDGTYTVFVAIPFWENEESHLYLDEFVFSGDELETLSEITIPGDDILVESNISAPADFDMSRLGVAKEFTDYHNERFYYQMDFHSIVSTSNLTLPFHIEGIYNSETYILFGDVEIGKDINVENLISHTVNVTNKNNVSYLQIDNESKNLSAHLNETENFKITKGEYGVYFHNNYYWKGNVSLLVDSELTLPEKPDSLTIKEIHQYSSPSGEVSISGKLEISNGEFEVYSSSTSAKFELYSADQVVQTWNNSLPYFHSSVNLKKGNYVMKVTFEDESISLVAKKELELNSATQDLTGTIVSAENVGGEELQDASFELFELTSYGTHSSYDFSYSGVFDKQIEKFEGFIPDAYLLKGQPYLLVVKSADSKVIYAKRIVGQEQDQYHLTAENLKPLSIEAGDLTVDEVQVSFEDKDNGYASTYPILITEETHVSSDLDTDMTIIAYDDQAAYSWNSVLDWNNENNIDLGNVEWKTISSAYENAVLSLYDFDLQKTFKEIKMSQEFREYDHSIFRIKMALTENEMTYSIIADLQNPQEDVILSFDKFIGDISFDQEDQYFHVFYYDKDYSYLEVTGGTTAKFTYEIREGDSGDLIQTVETDSFESIKLNEPLEEGNYILKLIDHTLNKELINLELNREFTVWGEAEDSMDLNIRLNPANPYGELDLQYNVPYMMIFKKVGDYSSFVGQLRWNSAKNALTTYHSLSINPDENYLLIFNGKTKNNYSPIIDLVNVSGQELIDMSNQGTEFVISDKLVEFDVSIKDMKTSNASMYLSTIINGRPLYSMFFYSHSNEPFKGYLPIGTYSGSVSANSETGEKYVFEIPSMEVKGITDVELKVDNHSKISFKNGTQFYKIYGFDMPNWHSINELYRYSYYDSDSGSKTLYYPKGDYKNKSFSVVSEKSLSTPWGYNVEVKELNLQNDVTINFDEQKISGTINEIHTFEDRLNVLFDVFSEDLKINGIYRFVEDQFDYDGFFSNNEPVREYTGLFEWANHVPVTYEVLDSKGNVIWKRTEKEFMDYFYDVPLENGKYVLRITIPTSKTKTVFSKEFSYGESSSFVNLHVDHKISNKESINISGQANANSSIEVDLRKGQTTVDSKTVTASDTGNFEVSFSPAEDGDYTVVATNGEVKAEVSFTIDRTAPAAVTELNVAKEGNGLKVTWKASETGATYKVEVAEGEGEFKTLVDKTTETSAVIENIKAGTTYKVKVTAIDTAGNVSKAAETSFTVDNFVATSVSMAAKLSEHGLLVIGDALPISVEGSYEAGYTASASVKADGKETTVPLTYNAETKKYEGTYEVKAGTLKIEGVSAFISNGTDKTDLVSNDYNLSVGSTVKGSVTDGDPVADATVRYVTSNKTITAKTDASGAYELKGIPAGDYKVNVVFNGKSYPQAAVKVGASEVKDVAPYQLPALVDASITLVDEGTTDSVMDGLSVRLTNDKGFAVYGSSKAGKFVPYGGASALNSLVAGNYKLTVFGQQLYDTTTADLTLEKGKKDYTVEVKKLKAETKDITIKITGDVKSLDSLSLFSHSVYSKFNYTGVGSYYKYGVSPTEGEIIIEDVAIAEDYELNIYAEGYMAFQKTVDLTVDGPIEVALEKGRVITGKVEDKDGKGILGVDVYAYGGNTYYSATTDKNGEYKLIGLSKETSIVVSVYSQIYLSENASIDKGTEDATQDFTLAKAASITGKVVDHEGKALSNVSVSAVSEDGSQYGWGRTASNGSFSINGLKDTEKFNLTFYGYGYPTVSETGVEVGDMGDVTLQKVGEGVFDGEGNHFAASKSTVVPGDTVQYTLSYKNNGKVKAENVPVTITLPEGLVLNNKTLTLNGKVVSMVDSKVEIPVVEAGESGKLVFSATVSSEVTSPSLTVKAKVTEDGTVLSTNTSVLFVTLEAPSQTGTAKVKVYGNARYGSTVEVYANNLLVGQTKVDGKWWYADVELPVKASDTEESFNLTAKVIDGNTQVFSKPVTVKYTPDVPVVKDVTVHAGWNGDVKLNPYTGVATFAIVEHTPLDTTVEFDGSDVDSAKLTFLGKDYEMKKGADGKFTFDGQKLGKWTSYGEQLLELTFKKGDVEVTIPLMNIIVLIDPSGFVFEGSMDNKLEGVQAVVETLDVNGNWVQWNAAMFGQINPQVTDSEGRYGWDVIAGKWRVIFTKEGYEPYVSRVMDVPPPETELNVPMVKIADPFITTTEVTADNLTVTFDRLMNVSNKADIKLYKIDGEERVEVEGTVETKDLSGYQSLTEIPAGKEDGFIGEIGKDSNGELGFFAADNSKKLSKTFKFVPNVALTAGADYVLVVSGQLADYAGKTVGEAVEFDFTKEETTSPGNPGNPGTPSTPGTGGGVPAPSTELGQVNVDPATGKQTVNVNAFEQLLNNPGNTLTLDATKLDDSKPISLSIPSSAALKAEGKVKEVVVKTDNTSIVIPVSVLKELAAAGNNVVINVQPVAKGSLLNGVTTVSNVFDFEVGSETNGKFTAVHNFKEDIKVSLKLASSPKDARKAAVYYVDEAANKLTYVGGKVANGVITFSASHFSKYVAIENNKTFKDIQSSGYDWARDYIEVLASRGIILGKSDTEFGPSSSITRAEFAVLVARALGLETTEYKGVFKDVPKSMTWGAKEIEAANAAGIINGFSKSEFKPNEKIKRQEMAAMISRALKYQDSKYNNIDLKTPNFTDMKSISAYAKEDVALAYTLSIISGYDVNGKAQFKPQDFANRAQAAKMLYQLMKETNEF